LISFEPEPSLFTQLRALPRRIESMALLDHENLDVYHRAIEFLTLALRLVARLPRAERELRDQLKRAAMSVPLNIAEGSGKPAPADRARFYAIARGSAMECGALVDVCRVAGFLLPAEVQDAKILLARIVAMLTRMCRG
jgi:four helix bundle protein